MGTRTGRGTRGLAIAALVVACALPLLSGSLAPYVTQADGNTAAFAQPARNYLRHGLLATRLGMAWNTGDAPVTRFAYNTHHPPLASLATAGVFLLTGVSDRAARIYPAVCSLGSALLLFLIWRRHRGAAPAAAATLMMAALPAFGHFGKMLGEEAPTLMFGLLTIELYQRWKEAPSPGSGRLFVLSYAAGCMSGWAGFYVGPLLMMDAAVTLRGRPGMRRRAVTAFAVTAVVCFGLILSHVAVLTGSVEALVDAAKNRTIGPEQVTTPAAPGGGRIWLGRQAGYFERLYGDHAMLLLAGGALAALAALARRRARAPAIMTVLVVAGVGLAHPLAFPWAAFYHDWLLFHLLPLVALAGAEGLFLLAGLVSRGLHLLRAPGRLAGTAASGVVLAGIAWHAALSVDQGLKLQREAPCYAWPLIGREISRLAGPEANIMANFPLLDAALRFYADRPSSTIRSLEAYDRVFASRPFALFVRDLDIPVSPELDRFLAGLPCIERAAFRLCALVPGSGTAAAVAAEAGASDPRETTSAKIDATFGAQLRLTGYAVTAPPSRAAPRAFLDRFFGLADQRALRDRIVWARTDWMVTEPPASPWRITTVMTVEPPGGGVSPLPEITLPARRGRIVGPDTAVGPLRAMSAFFLPDDYPDAWLHLRWGVDASGRTVQPVLPGPPRPLLKVVVSETIPVFGDGPAGGPPGL